MTAVVSEKGQVTIPKDLRNKLGLAKGTVIDFSAERGTLVGRKKMQADLSSTWTGAGKPFLRKLRLKNTDDYLRLVRDDHRR
jgi:AbrB family looped-hinge helix DNA binding protein